MQDYLRFVCVTANVESLASDPNLVKPWAAAVATEIAEQKPDFAAIHIQGATPVEPRSRDEPVFSPGHLYTKLVDNPELGNHFRTSRGFFDSEVGTNEYTGLGSIYLVQDPKTVEIWNVTNNSFSPIQQGHEFVDKVGRNPNVLRMPFPDKLNPNSRASSGFSGFFGSKNSNSGGVPTPAGFLTTKFRIFGRPFGFSNLQLHSNSSVGFRDLRQSLSEGALVRQDQIQFMLQRLDSTQIENEAHYFAGAFNSELDQDALIKDMTKHMSGASRDKIGPDGAVQNMEYFDFKGQPLVTLGDQEFDFHSSHDWYFGFSRGQMVKKYNGEISKDLFAGILHEAPVYFSPTAHYSFNKREDKDSFMRHRCPQWADRIFCNENAWDLMKYDSFSGSGLYYGIIGTNEYLGSHKPVAMHATICVKPSKGTFHGTMNGLSSPKISAV